MKKSRRMMLLLLLITLVSWSVVANLSVSFRAAVAAQTNPSTSEDRQDDRAAIQSTIDGFRTAFEAGDAKSCATFWTAEGEYISEGGSTIRGRLDVEKSYAEWLAKYPKPKIELERVSLRFLSKDTAVEEGHFNVRVDAKATAVRNRYSMLFVREEGKWKPTTLH